MKHTIFSYRRILSLNDESHVPGLKSGPDKKTIEINHNDNKFQRNSNHKSSSSDNSDDEADYANDTQNLNFNSVEDSQVVSRQLKYKIVFTFTSNLWTSIVDFHNYK